MPDFAVKGTNVIAHNWFREPKFEKRRTFLFTLEVIEMFVYDSSIESRARALRIAEKYQSDVEIPQRVSIGRSERIRKESRKPRFSIGRRVFFAMRTRDVQYCGNKRLRSSNNVIKS